MMNRKLIATTLLSLSFSAISGMMVSDIQSYSYFAEQLENDATELETQAEELDTAIEAYELASDTADLLQKAYNKSTHIINDLQSDVERAGDEPLKFASEVVEDIDDFDSKAHRDDIKASIEEEYSKGNGWKQVQYNEALANEAMEDVIVQAEELESYSMKNASLLEELASEANNASNEKEAQDVTNAILTEMLRIQTNIQEMLTATSKSFAMAHVTAMSKSIEEAEQEAEDSETAEETDYTPIFDSDYEDHTQSTLDALDNIH